MGRIYDDITITDVRMSVNAINKQLQYLKIKGVDKPFDDKDYKLFYSIVESIQRLDGSRWTKEWY